MEIGLFQLENLFLNPNRFYFFDLRPDRAPVAPTIDGFLSRATGLLPQELSGHLQSQQTPFEFPVILLCQDGRISSDLARELEVAGYTNIYVVTGGVVGLLSEL